MEPDLNTMKDVWIAADNIVSPLGLTSQENYQQVREGKSGITILHDPAFSVQPLYAGWISPETLSNTSQPSSFTKFEWLSILSIRDVLRQLRLDTTSERTLFILSTTKGNIELLNPADAFPDKRIYLHETAKTIASYFGNRQQPLVVSNACISGIMALLVARRLLLAGQYDHAIVTGADVLTHFVISGFQSLQAISPEQCKPFDATRKGVNLGEAAATVVLTADPDAIESEKKIKIIGGGLSNDANHISGPSRTGEELAIAMQQAIHEAGINKNEIDFISAHGTATLYNDEMEAKAFNHAGLRDVPLNSLKGYFGHTLGAAGIVETIISMHAMARNELIPTLGFKTLGVSQRVNVIAELEHKRITTCVKTASGFGGCNAALLLNKV